MLLASWIAPMDAPMVHHGAVLFDHGRIIAIGPQTTLRTDHADAVNVGDSLVLPGLVNAHAHLELSNCTPGAPPAGGFGAWLRQRIQYMSADPEKLADTITHAVSIGIEQCLRFGITTVGDITRQPHLTRPLLSRSPLNIISCGEIQSLGQRRMLLDQRLFIALDPTHATARLSIGLSPHAPYTVEPAAYQRCLQLARQHNLPLATHLAESPDEAEFLAHHTGPFRELWESLNAWDDQVPHFDGGPIRFAQSLGLLDHPTLLAHVNYCDNEELSILAAGRASVVYCPRTHTYFNHPPHRWRDMLARGINVALGTDSCASSPDLNLVDDLRLLHHIAPDVPVQTLWEMATVRAARALQLDQQVGSITAGKAADFAIFPVKTDDPLREVLEGNPLPSQIWIGGGRIPLTGPEADL